MDRDTRANGAISAIGGATSWYPCSWRSRSTGPGFSESAGRGFEPHPPTSLVSSTNALTCDDAMFMVLRLASGMQVCAIASVSMRPGVANTRPNQSSRGTPEICTEASDPPMNSSASVFATWRSASRSVWTYGFELNATRLTHVLAPGPG